LPRKVIIDTIPIFPRTLEKDLQENEVICETCKGLGVIVDNNPYYLKEEGSDLNNLFPYKKQSIRFCPDCYNGVRRVCKFCGKPGDRGYIYPEDHCDCEGAKKFRAQKELKCILERYKKAKKITLQDAIYNGIEMVYIDNTDSFVPIEQLEEEVEEILRDNPNKNLRIYSTIKRSLYLDAREILESEIESQDLHDEAYENIPEDKIEELQCFLDQWLKEISGTETYEPDFNTAIVIPIGIKKGIIINKTKEELIEELKKINERNPDRICRLWLLNQNVMSSISNNCLKCKKHDVITFGGKNFHICYDDFTGITVGWHVIYFETIDLCIECGGFESKEGS